MLLLELVLVLMSCSFRLVSSSPPAGEGTRAQQNGARTRGGQKGKNETCSSRKVAGGRGARISVFLFSLPVGIIQIDYIRSEYTVLDSGKRPKGLVLWGTMPEPESVPVSVLPSTAS